MSSCLSRCEIIDSARNAGAVAAAFAPCIAVDEAEIALYDNWIDRRAHAGMEYMERYREVRNDPRLLLDGAVSILCCAFPYAQPDDHRSPLFSDYAVGDDYHEVLRKRLAPVAELMEKIEPGSKTRICIDTAPIRERYWASRAGIGFIGLNNQLIVPGIGSKVFLAEILWTSEADYGRPLNTECGHCGACVKACPGHALDGKGSIDCHTCLSYLTIEHRGDLPKDLKFNGRIYGCDICQDVCPHNRQASPALPEFKCRDSIFILDRERIASMTQPEFSAIFTHSAVKRAKLAGLQRNARDYKTHGICNVFHTKNVM